MKTKVISPSGDAGNYSCHCRFQSGLTLVEVMIVMVIVAVAAAVSLPWYGDYVRKSRISEGAELASLAKVKAAELVTIGQVSSGGVPHLRMYSVRRGMPLPESQSEVIVSNTSSSAYVTQVLRVDASYIVTYSPNLSPNKDTVYSLVYYADVNDGKVTWTCLAGSRAADPLEIASWHSRGVSLGDPMPAEYAPAGCLSS